MSAKPLFSGDRRVVVDWDGTLVKQAWPEQPQEWLPGAVAALRSFLDADLDVVIFSTRLAPRAVDEYTSRMRVDKEREVRYIRKMLDDAGLEQVSIWRRPWKPGALFYVDDKAVKFDGSWKKVLKEVLA